MENYLRAAWCPFKREKSFTLITVIGLALGLAACIFIFLFVSDEFAYDRYNVHADRIYRVAADLHINGGAISEVSTPAGMAPALVRDFPDIEKAVRIRAFRRELAVHIEDAALSSGSAASPIGRKTFLQSGAVLADSSLFDVFTLPLIEGDPHTALSEPNAIVLSASTAMRYYNDVHVLGRTLRLDEDTAVYIVRAVMRDMPETSHVHFQLIRSMQQRRDDWINLFAATYILTRPGVTTTRVDQLLRMAVSKYLDPQLQEQLHSSLADVQRKGDYFHYYAMPLPRIHLHSNLGSEFEPNGNISYVLLFLAVAVLILLVACINFVNLSIARSLKRVRTIGVQKLLGAGRWRLAFQFLLESVLATFFAMLLALFLVAILLPLFNQLAGKHFGLSILFSRWTVLVCLLTTLLTGLLSGLYPALLLSRIDPLTVLRGRAVMGIGTPVLRTVLLVFQFSVAMMLVIGTGVIYSQLDYIRHREIGYDRSQMLTVKDTRSLGDGVWIFAEQAKRIPGVEKVTVSGFLPNRPVPMRGFFKDQSGSETSTVLLADWQIDADYLSTLDMRMESGRNFSPQLPTDSGCVLINETAARTLGYARPVGQKIYTADDLVNGYRIIGVVRDFNTGSLHNPIDPVIFRLARDGSAVSFRLAPGDIRGTLQAIGRQYHAVAKNGHPFTYSFLDDDFNRLYEADRRTGQLFTIFSILAVVIAAMGIFGLVTVAVRQRTKEMGIRRVLGARVYDLVLLLLKGYGLTIVLSVLIALPVGAWAMHRWLEGFAYRTVLHPWIFVTAAMGTAAMTTLIVGLRAGRAGWFRLAPILRDPG